MLMNMLDEAMSLFVLTSTVAEVEVNLLACNNVYTILVATLATVVNLIVGNEYWKYLRMKRK